LLLQHRVAQPAYCGVGPSSLGQGSPYAGTQPPRDFALARLRAIEEQRYLVRVAEAQAAHASLRVSPVEGTVEANAARVSGPRWSAAATGSGAAGRASSFGPAAHASGARGSA